MSLKVKELWKFAGKYLGKGMSLLEFPALCSLLNFAGFEGVILNKENPCEIGRRGNESSVDSELGTVRRT